MALNIYDRNQTLLTPGSVTRTFHDGYAGGVWEDKFYIRNDDATRYYVSVAVFISNELYDDAGGFGTTGWSIKVLYGETQPTEKDWELVRSDNTISIPEIGSTLAANTSSYYPFWVRVICPGLEPAQIRSGNKIRVTAISKIVGA